jgi:hypothetical protein
MKWCGRDLIWGSTPALAWGDWGKPRKNSVRIAGLWAEIWTRELPNTKQECQPIDRKRILNRMLRFYGVYHVRCTHSDICGTMTATTLRLDSTQVGSDLEFSRGCCWPRPGRGGGGGFRPFYWSAWQVGPTHPYAQLHKLLKKGNALFWRNFVQNKLISLYPSLLTRHTKENCKEVSWGIWHLDKLYFNTVQRRTVRLNHRLFFTAVDS